MFRLGGVLVGSYAFVVLGNLLGVRWLGSAWRTQDVDIAGHLQVAVPELEADIPGALESLQMGFVPIPQLDSRQPSSSSRVRGKTLQVDLLTPGFERDREPIYIPRFKAAAAPIKHLSLVMQDAQPAAVVEAGATLIVVPAPARFALHKLFVSQTRSVIQQTKGGKDLHQAALADKKSKGGFLTPTVARTAGNLLDAEDMTGRRAPSSGNASRSYQTETDRTPGAT